jgi:hypothetical protein
MLLADFSSCFLVANLVTNLFHRAWYTKAADTLVNIASNWGIQFLEGGPILPQRVNLEKLGSWTNLVGDDVKHFSGLAKYTTTFSKPSSFAMAYQLNLGQVHETAEVFLIGKKLATLIGPLFQLTILTSEVKDTNMLEVVVANLMANRICYIDKYGLPWKIFYNTNMPAHRKDNTKNGLFDASRWTPLPSGLLGPVTLTPLTYE